ncbi:MAG: replicative DNA helicase [Gemmatimonadota bacterium]
MAEPARTIARTDAFADRQPPWSPEAEVSVLGGMLLDANAVAKAIEFVQEAMFYREAHRRLFRSMRRLFERGQPIDAVTLTEELKSDGTLDSVGGQEYVAEILEAVPTAANIEYHCRIVREKALLRRLIESATQIIQDAFEAGQADIDEVLDVAEQRVFEIAQAYERGGFVRLKELIWKTFEYIEKLEASAGGVTGVASGFADLDRYTAGFQNADLVVVAGRPSMGKTAITLNFAQHAAIDNQIPVALFSLEMSKEQIVQRLLCSEARVDSNRLRTGRLQADDYTRLSTAAGHLSQAPMWIDDTPALTALELRAKARRLKAEVDVKLIVVDYLQLMQGPREAENRVQEISAISRALKAVAKELDIPVLALSQLSRAPEQRQDHRPQLADLRESGAIEQDADVVLFLYRPGTYASPQMMIENPELETQAELIIGKQRNGPTGSIQLIFRKEFTRFESFSPRAAEG